MTLLSSLTAVANEAGYLVSTTAISSTDVTTKQLVAIAQRVIREMAIAYPWSKLFRSSSITLATGTASYALPGDFSYYHYDTFWNQSTRWRVLGPMTEQQYADIQGYGLNPTVYQRMQLRGITGTQLLISPTATSSENGDIIIFEYISDRCVRPATWTASTSYAANSYTFYNGNYYQTTAGGTSGSTAPTHTSGSQSDGGVTWAYYSGSYSTFLADTDVPILSDRVLEQGMLERFAEIHGLDGVKERFIDQLNEEFSKDIPGKILYAGGEYNKHLFARSGVATFGTPLG